MDELSRRLGDPALDLPLPSDLVTRVELGARRQRRRRQTGAGGVAAVVVATLALNLVSTAGEGQDARLALGQARAVAAVPQAALDRLAAADTAFGLDLLHQLCAAKPHSNVLLSPASIAAALDLAYAGARGRTATEIGKVLHQPAYGPALVDALATRRQRLAPLADQLQQRDTVWADKRAKLNRPYLDDVRTAQDAGVRRVDFDRPEPARRTINDEVARETAGLVKQLLPQGSVDEDTRLVLADTLHLSAQWEKPFPPARTEPDTFLRAEGRGVDVPFMQQRDRLPTARVAGYVATELPYQRGRLSMLLLLPDDPRAGCSALTYPALRSVAERLGVSDTRVRVPKLRLDQQSGLDRALRALGMRTAYAKHRADFTRMTATPLYVKTVQHRSVMRLDEKGTEDAAATSAVFELSGGPRFNIAFDRPFALMLRDRSTGRVLSSGV